MSDPLVEEFVGYCVDIALTTTDEKSLSDKFRSVLGKLSNESVRRASSSLLPLDMDISSLTDNELADKMQMHVTSRSSEHTIRLQNSAWSMMLDAANRLRKAGKP